MNAVQTKQRIDFYLNLTQNARFNFSEYAMAVNDVIQEFIFDNLGDKENRNPKNFQWIDRINDQLYTLIKTATPTPSAGTAITNQYYTSLPSTITYPTDYSDFISLTFIVDGYTVWGRPITFNKLQPMLADSFRHPTNSKIYYNWNATGFTFYRANSGSLTNCTLTYIKQATDFSIGQESQLVTGVLTNAAVYYATEVSVYSGTTYQIGATITGTGASLTSGAAILASNTSPIDLPAQTHEEIAKRAAARMLQNVGDYQGAQAVLAAAEQSV